jgi:hypothetical protein
VYRAQPAYNLFLEGFLKERSLHYPNLKGCGLLSLPSVIAAIAPSLLDRTRPRFLHRFFARLVLTHVPARARGQRPPLVYPHHMFCHCGLTKRATCAGDS